MGNSKRQNICECHDGDMEFRDKKTWELFGQELEKRGKYGWKCGKNFRTWEFFPNHHHLDLQ